VRTAAISEINGRRSALVGGEHAPAIGVEPGELDQAGALADLPHDQEAGTQHLLHLDFRQPVLGLVVENRGIAVFGRRAKILAKGKGPPFASLDHRSPVDGNPLHISFVDVSVKLTGSNKWIDAQ
jgi:hypothetical protein